MNGIRNNASGRNFAASWNQPFHGSFLVPQDQYLKACSNLIKVRDCDANSSEGRNETRLVVSRTRGFHNWRAVIFPSFGGEASLYNGKQDVFLVDSAWTDRPLSIGVTRTVLRQLPVGGMQTFAATSASAGSSSIRAGRNSEWANLYFEL